MIGSHNSFSFLPIKGWKKILKPWVKCQKYNIVGQYSCNVRYFDIRVRLHEGEWWLCHNSALFDKLENRQEDFMFIGRQKASVRIILDVRKAPKNATEYKSIFLNSLIPTLRLKYDLNIDSIIVFWEWREYCLYKNIVQHEYHVSVSAPWYKYILGTKLFAKLNNKNHLELKEDTKQVMLLDYVNYR